QAAWHAEIADEFVEHVAGVLAGMAHGLRDQLLALRVDGFVPAHHEGEHHAGGVAVWHAVHGAEDVTDAVARAHRDAGAQGSHREPGADLAIHPRIEIARVRLHPR